MTSPQVLDREQVRAAVDVDQLTEELGAALRSYTGEGAPQRIRVPINDDLTAMVLVPGRHEGIPAYTVKVHAKNPTAREAVHGTILLHRLPDGALLSIMDSGWLTAQRTALSAAYVHDHLTAAATPGPVAIIGAGVQGATFARALQRRRPSVGFRIHDPDAARAESLRAELGEGSTVAATVEQALTTATSAMTATWGRRPVTEAAALAACEHITVLGMDEPGKRELPEETLAGATRYADDPALVEPILQRPTTPISLVLRGERIARSAHDRTVYLAVGLPMQDCVAAWHVHNRAG